MAAWFDSIIHKKKKAAEKSEKADQGKAAKTLKPKKEEPKAAPLSGPPEIRVVFMGTPSMAATALLSLADHDYNIVGVVTKPDKPVGRTQETVPSAVKVEAMKLGLPLLEPQKLDPETIEAIKAWKPDLIVVFAYGKILPQALLDVPGFGCINIHTSLLPKWRGASPIQNALLAGESETGVTIMLMDAGMDTGDILKQEKLSIDPLESREDLTKRMTESASGLLLEVIPEWIERTLVPVKQNNAEATLCQLIERGDGKIIWSDDAESLYHRYRALHPWPGIFTFWKKGDELLRLKLLSVSYQKQDPQIPEPIGKVFEVGEKVGVKTGQGILFLEEIQLEGKTPVSIQEFIRGYPEFTESLLQ